MPEGKKCDEEIKAIRDEYNRIMDNRQKNRLSKGSKGADIRDCEAGKSALEARIQESQSQPASQALHNLCQEHRGGAKNTVNSGFTPPPPPPILNFRKDIPITPPFREPALTIAIAFP